MGARRLRFASVADSVPEQHERVMNGDWNLRRLRLEGSPRDGKCTSPFCRAVKLLKLLTKRISHDTKSVIAVVKAQPAQPELAKRAKVGSPVTRSRSTEGSS